MDIILNLDLLSVGVVVAAIGVMGFAVFFSNRESITNQTFFVFSIVTIFWGIVNYLFYNISNQIVSLWLLKVSLFFAILVAFFIFKLLFVFPLSKITFPTWYKNWLIPITILTSIFTLTPLVIAGVKEFSSEGRILTASNGPMMPLFAVLSILLIIGSLYHLFKKIWAVTKKERKPYWLILTGVFITFALIIVFNLVLPTIFDNSRFVPLGAVFFFPFIAFTSYAILRHHLFSTKAMWAGVLVFALAIASFLEVIFATGLNVLIFRGSVFLLVLMVGILLIKGVLKEVEIRERMEKLALELADANRKLQELDQQKSEFLSIASHQLRTPLTAIKGYSSMILEGSFGEIANEKMREAIDRVFDSSQRLVVIVNDLLNVSRIEQGRMKYDFNTFNMKEASETVINEMRPIIEKKKLEFEVKIEDADYTMTADAGKLSQVISNLLDNAVKYTPSGKISFHLSKKNDGKILFSVTDTGVGVPKGEETKLFKKFSRTADASKTSTSGTGLGLYVVDQMIKAHKGRVWVESAGKGKGSTFFVEVPITAVAPKNSA